MDVRLPLHVTSALVALSVCACGSAPGLHRTDVERAPARVDIEGEGEPYEVRMSWPVAEGDRARVTWKLERTETTRRSAPSGETLTESRRTAMVLRAIEEVLEVDDLGGATALVLHVEAMSFDESGASSVRLKNATVRIDRAPRAEDASVAIDGSPASTALRAAIDEAVSLELPAGPSDDEVFGVSRARRLGARWSIDGELARSHLQRGRMRIPRGAVSGEMHLAETFEEDGATYLQLEGKMDVRRFDFERLEGGAIVERGVMAMRMVNVVPAQGPRRREEQSITTKTEMVVAIPSRGHVHVTTEESTSWAFEALSVDAPDSDPPAPSPEI